jgi:hypothetical protein
LTTLTTFRALHMNFTKLDLGVSKAKLKAEIKKHCEINNLEHVLFINQTKTIAGDPYR